MAGAGPVLFFPFSVGYPGDPWKISVQKSRNPNMLISVIFLQILSKFINISSIYHGYSVILDVGNIHEIQNLI